MITSSSFKDGFIKFVKLFTSWKQPKYKLITFNCKVCHTTGHEVMYEDFKCIEVMCLHTKEIRMYSKDIGGLFP